MVVKQNDMTYDESDKRCKVYTCQTHATRGYATCVQFAFITVIDDSTDTIKRYCGVFDINDFERSIREIMDIGGKWPHVFDN